MSHEHSHAHGHSHAHAHPHGGGPPSAARALVVSLVLNGAFLVIEGAIGLVTGSLALLSDAAHMLSDVGALALALGASVLASRPTLPSRTFGLRRAEVVGGFVNSLSLLLACAYITWEAIGRLRGGPPEIAGLPVLIVGAIGLAINLGSAWMLARADRGNLNIRAALAHMLADALGSLGAMVAAVLLMYGYNGADPIVSLFIAGLVLWGTWGLLRDTAAILLQFPPRGLRVEPLRLQLAALDGVESVHDLHVWTLDGRSAILSVHLVSAPGLDPHELRRSALQLLADEHGVKHATVQIESASGPPCELERCSTGGL